MDKSADAFRTISEVSDLLETPTHVLRFWETRFPQIRPVKRAGGRRYFRPTDVALLAGIKRLLHDDGLTIRGVQKILKEQGVGPVIACSPLHLGPTGDAPLPGVASTAPEVPSVQDAADADPPPAVSPLADLPELDTRPASQSPALPRFDDMATAGGPANVTPLRRPQPILRDLRQPSLFDLTGEDAPEAPMALDVVDPDDTDPLPQVIRLAPTAPPRPRPETAPVLAPEQVQHLLSALAALDPATLTPAERIRLLSARDRLSALHQRMTEAPRPATP